jgi:hypothetical protein
VLRTGAESRGAEIKLPPGAGAEITNCGSGFRSSSGSFLFIEDVNKCIKKIMVAKEVFLNYYNFNPILGTTCINPCNKVLVLKSKRVIVKVSYKIYSEPGLKPELEPEPQFGFAALQSRSRSQKRHFRLRNSG